MPDVASASRPPTAPAHLTDASAVELCSLWGVCMLLRLLSESPCLKASPRLNVMTMSTLCSDYEHSTRVLRLFGALTPVVSRYDGCWLACSVG